jgi:competence protein ComEA
MQEDSVAETRKKQFWIVAFIILIAAIVVTASIAWTKYRPSLPIEITLPPPQTISGNIYVGGAVNNPGIYTFSGDDTVTSLLQAAGGVTADGNSGSLELNIAEANVTAAPQKININTAEEWLLDALPGIGTTKAQAIIDYRTKNGFFRNIDELTKVKGISASVLAKIRPFITVAE